EVRIEEGYAHGAVDYITTPVVPAILRAKVRVFCDLYRMTQLVQQQADERIALTEERTKREAAEEANRRLTFSARCGTVLGQSLDQGVTLRDCLRLAIPFLADEVVLYLPSPGSEAAKISRARLVEGEPLIEESMSPDELPATLQIAIERALEEDVETGKAEDAAVVLPLRTQGRTFAVMGLSREASGRRFTPPDVTLAEAYASRAATALENARLYHEVQDADRQKNDFLSMLAHELRNPLAPIRNANSVLHDRATDPERVHWAQRVIDRQLAHLVRLVDDLLDVSRLTLGKIRLSIQPVDVNTVVEQAIEATRPLVEQVGHQLQLTLAPRPQTVNGDPARLTQVLTNLLNNAVKYTDPGGLITLSVQRVAAGSKHDAAAASNRASSAAEPAAWVEIRVRDTGIGIPTELLSTMFNLFTQASRSLDRSQGGLGVGLTLVRKLVEMHQGTVEAFSDGPGKGSEFVVRLPAIAGQPHPTANPAQYLGGRSPRGEPLRLVVVDDNVDGANTLAEILGMLGHEVRVAYDGPSAFTVVREFDPDLVMLDIGLPGMDGYQVARRLRAENDSRAMLVALSGYGRDEDRVLSRESGFAHHFVKPVDFGELRNLLDSLRGAGCAGNAGHPA
ncbi:MAG TPA: ATP-binding protein, partial [Gemmata sp.]|nr:ATP-binding protein [Gemmata sp.]